MFIESLVMEALDPEKEKLISKVNYIRATRSDSIMNVIVQVTSIFQDVVIMEEGIG